jgi:carbonic anhydrase
MTFCAVVNCMDGRVQLPVITYLMKELGVSYVDSITEAGPVRHLAEEPDSERTASIVSRIAVSLERHSSDVVAIVAHHDCGGNPVPMDQQLGQLDRAVEYVAERFRELEVIGLWVDDSWRVTEITRRARA